MGKITHYFFFFIGILLVGCAQVTPLDGGPRDVHAPVPDIENMQPPFASVNCFPKEIRIPFDEYIQLNNPSANIVMVPDIKPRPEFSVKKKELIIDLTDAELDSNTTYAFYFNKAIKDFREGNDSIMTYVFATGPVIDSLSYSVVIYDAYEEKPVNQAIVGLYVDTDSLNPYKHKPKYFAQTDQQGKAQFSYLAKGEYRVFAFKGGSSTLVPGKADPIAFKSNIAVIDTLANNDTLRMFPVEYSRLQFRKKEIISPGRIELTATRSFADATFKVEKDSIPVDILLQKTDKVDSVFLFIQGEENAAYQVSVHWADTSLQTRLFMRKSTTNLTQKCAPNTNAGELEMFDTLTFSTTLPVQQIHDSLIRIYTPDSLLLPFTTQQKSITSFQLLTSFENEKEYRVEMYPGAVTSIYPQVTIDTLRTKVKRKTEKYYANLELILVNKPDIPLLCRLFLANNLFSEFKIESNDSTLMIPYLNPGSYTVQFILDANGNGKWDSGSYPEKTQPEECIWFREPMVLRMNWDASFTLKFKQDVEELPEDSEE